MKKQNLLILLTFALGVLGFQSCYPDPEFDLTPNITFREVEQHAKVNRQNVKYDSLVIVVRFQDGDGNLGLSATNPEDASGDFGSGKQFHHNFFVKMYKKVNGDFQLLLIGGKPIPLSGRFPRISTDTRIEPLEGDIRFSLPLFPNNLLKPNDTVRFDIQIADRAKNLSNVVSTSEIVLFSK